MRTIVPLIGVAAVEKNPALKKRIYSIIEEELGHEVMLADAGSIHSLHRADPLCTFVPFSIIAHNAVDSRLVKDWVEPILTRFPSSTVVQEDVEYLPVALRSRAQELSLAHVNGAATIIRRLVKVIYKNLDRPEFRVPSLTRELGISKSSLERECTKFGSSGAAHWIKHIRMTEARRLIQESDAPVNAISFAVGYPSLQSFDRAFFAFWSTSATYLRQNVKSVNQKDNA